jgi:hypothetical protein
VCKYGKPSQNNPEIQDPRIVWLIVCLQTFLTSITHRAEFISGHGWSFLLIAEQEAIPAEQGAILMSV